MLLANSTQEMVARMSAEDREPDDRIAAAVGVSLLTIEHWKKRIDENRTGVANKEVV